MKRLYYIKQGRRYKPVAEYDSDLMDSFPKGSHLVCVYPGGQSTRFGVDPAYAPMIAAGRVAEDAICRAIYAQGEARPNKQLLTKRQRAAWEEMKAAFGDEFFSIEFSSTHDLAEAGVKAMQEEANKLLTNKAVKLAYDHFLMVCELTKENRNGT